MSGRSGQKGRRSHHLRTVAWLASALALLLLACDDRDIPYVTIPDNLSTLEGQPLTVRVGVSDLGSITAVRSHDQSLVPDANLDARRLSDQGETSRYDLSITPAERGSGQVDITIDIQRSRPGGGVTPGSKTFTLTILPGGSLRISEIADQQAVVGQATTVRFGVSDEEHQVTMVSASSGHLGVVADEALQVVEEASGGHSHRLTITPHGVGSATITVFAENDDGDLQTRSFALTVTDPVGETITWTGAAGDGLWTTAANWDLARLPSVADAVVIPAGSGTVTIEASDDDTATNVAVRRLSHGGGTLHLLGPANCGGCQWLSVLEGVSTSSTGDARLLLEGAALFIGAASTLRHVEGVHHDDRSGGGELRSLWSGLWGTGGSQGEQTPSLVLTRLDGPIHVVEDLDLSVTEGGQVLGQLRLDLAGSLTIAAGAEIEMLPPPLGSDFGVVGASGTELVVEGRLSSTAILPFRLGLPLTVAATGEIAFPSLDVAEGLSSHGSLDVGVHLTFHRPLQPEAASVTLHPGSTTQAGTRITQRAPMTVGGVLRTPRFVAAERSAGVDAPLLVSDAALLEVGLMEISGSPATIVVPSEPAGPVASEFYVLSPSILSLAGPHPLRVGELRIVLGTEVRIVGLDAAAALSTELLQIGSGSGTLLLDGVGLELWGLGTVRSETLGRGGAWIRVLEGGLLRFSDVAVRPDPDHAEGALAFEHLGAIQAWSGASSLEACISVGAEAETLPANGGATLTQTQLCAGP